MERWSLRSPFARGIAGILFDLNMRHAVCFERVDHHQTIARVAVRRLELASRRRALHALRRSGIAPGANMYLASIVLLMLVLPAGCVIGQMLWFGGAADVMLLVGKWLVFRAAGGAAAIHGREHFRDQGSRGIRHRARVGLRQPVDGYAGPGEPGGAGLGR